MLSVSDEAAGFAVETQAELLGGSVAPTALPGHDDIAVVEFHLIIIERPPPLRIDEGQLSQEPSDGGHIQGFQHNCPAVSRDGRGVEMPEGRPVNHRSRSVSAMARKILRASPVIASGVSARLTVSSHDIFRPSVCSCAMTASILSKPGFCPYFCRFRTVRLGQQVGTQDADVDADLLAYDAAAGRRVRGKDTPEYSVIGIGMPDLALGNFQRMHPPFNVMFEAVGPLLGELNGMSGGICRDSRDAAGRRRRADHARRRVRAKLGDELSYRCFYSVDYRHGGRC